MAKKLKRKRQTGGKYVPEAKHKLTTEGIKSFVDRTKKEYKEIERQQDEAMEKAGEVWFPNLLPRLIGHKLSKLRKRLTKKKSTKPTEPRKERRALPLQKGGFNFKKGNINQPYDEQARIDYETRVRGHYEPLITEDYDIDQRDLGKIGTDKDIFLDTTVKKLEKRDKSINPVTGEKTKGFGFGPDYPDFRTAFQANRKRNAAFFIYDGKEYSTLTRVEKKQGISAGSKQHLANMRSSKDYVDWTSKKKDSFRLKKKRKGGWLEPPTEKI
tara:strand:+ start:99 stop:908 length:810 start_codon:yes stop_codon:yes gene_type:complete